MPIQHFTGNNNYNTMACHVYVLSGNPAIIDQVNQRYQNLGEYLLGRTALPQNNNTVPNGLNVVTAGQIRNAMAETGDELRIEILGLLCIEFGLVLQPGSGIRLWGHFEDAQLLPEHMYVTYTNGNIYDTMPNAPIRRNLNVNGTNPPSYNGAILDANVIANVEVLALPAGTMTPINAPNNQWANGME
jgi:hypothetical protein